MIINCMHNSCEVANNEKVNNATKDVRLELCY